MTAFTVIIPARYASSRLPGKPLSDIAGKPMIQWVYEQACQSSAQRVVIATDDERILEACKFFGAEVVMTAEDHQSGTDRLQEVVETLGLPADDIVVNVQGDEPLIPPAVIDQVAENLASHDKASVSTLSETIESAETFFDPNAVKVVSDTNGIALYFSRAPIPWARDEFTKDKSQLPEGLKPQRHIGIYGYRVSLLHEFVTWPAAPLETIECLEQLRVMWNGKSIHVAEACEAVPGGVDTPQDLEAVNQLLKS
ncbi:MAG: 3-deoxy-manno-octulosonate cytidylyltransferase [Cellvibrionaceae bacterium]